jgi:hypothetical protein
MFQPSADKVERARTISRVSKIDASVKGWHMNEPVSAMDPQAAVQLDNWFPEPGGLRLRYGYQQYATLPGMSGMPVQTLMTYLSGATQKLFAAAGTSTVYDVTPGGTGTSSLTGMHSDRWQWINFATPAGQFLCAVNNSDPMQTYGPSGSGGALQWQASAITGPTAPLTNIWSFMGHLFFTEQNTSNVWWLPANAISGTAQSIPMGSLLYKGGYMVAGGQWTYATAYAVINLYVIVSSEGEVIVYSGTDPSSTSTWNKIGQFTIGRPIPWRCMLEINSDLVCLCEDGLMPMSKALQFDRAAAVKAAFTWDIEKAFSDAYQQYSGSFNWAILNYPWSHMALINVPSGPSAPAPPGWPASTTGNMQFILDLLTGAWCRYVGLDAMSWVVMQDRIFFGDRNGVVWQAETGSADKGGSASPQPITATWVSAYNDLDAPGRLKQPRAMRVVFLADPSTTFNPKTSMSPDYDYAPPAAIPIVVSGLSGNTQAVWAAAGSIGYQFAATVSVSFQGPVPATSDHIYITACYVLNEAGAWLG